MRMATVSVLLASILPVPVRCTLLVAACLLAGCQSGPLADHDRPHDYRLSFADGSWLKSPVRFSARVEFEGGEALYLRLRGNQSDLASGVAKDWSRELNRRHSNSSDSISNTLTIRRVMKIELLEPLRDIELRDLGASP
ncbi:MAG TPA: hypothetical protein VGC54_09145 [Planctomycetota bacterium]